ncbi:MAG TPA: AbrB/MazE/SpoVT family DNA-binding domain-containing protein [Vicinamibacterales bacterium]
MTITIDAAGRVVIPAAVRREARIEPGMPLEVRFHDGVIEIEPAALPVTLERQGRMVVAKPVSRMPTLTAETVERTRRNVRRSRRGR